MENFENIFICYSPIHITASYSLSHKKSLVILPKKYAPILKFLPSKKVNIKYAFISTFTDKYIQKIFSLFYNLIIYYKLKYKCKNLFIPNAAHHVIRIISKSIEYKYLNYLDEGSTALSLIREKKIIFNSNKLSKFCLGILGIKVGDNFLDERFHNFYVFYPHILKKLLPNKNIKSIPPINLSIKEKNLLKKNINPKSNCETILFLTSPLSENGWVEYQNQEIDLIKQFLNQLNYVSNNYCVYFKPHYREKITKYKKFLERNNCYLLSNNIPSQILSSILNPKIVVGFHSSALFEYQSVIKIISLTKLINTPQCRSLSNGLGVYKNYFKELTLLENFCEISCFI